MPQLENSAGSPQTHHNACFAWASRTLQRWPTGTALFEAIPSLRNYVSKRPITYPVYASPLLFTNAPVFNNRKHRSARGATLGNGGWLTLTMPGLSPDQMRHALRGALTIKLTDAHEAPAEWASG